MSERTVLLGLPAAGGVAVGRALVLRDIEADAGGDGGAAERGARSRRSARVGGGAG